MWCVQPYGRTHREPGPGCGVPGRRRESLWPLGTWHTASPPSDLQHHRKEQDFKGTHPHSTAQSMPTHSVHVRSKPTH